MNGSYGTYASVNLTSAMTGGLEGVDGGGNDTADNGGVGATALDGNVACTCANCTSGNGGSGSDSGTVGAMLNDFGDVDVGVNDS